jgi:hypothetical protein
MANLAGIVQQLRKERDQSARTVKRLDAALAALARSQEIGLELAAACLRQYERGSLLRSEHAGIVKVEPAIR